MCYVCLFTFVSETFKHVSAHITTLFLCEKKEYFIHIQTVTKWSLESCIARAKILVSSNQNYGSNNSGINDFIQLSIGWHHDSWHYGSWHFGPCFGVVQYLRWQDEVGRGSKICQILSMFRVKNVHSELNNPFAEIYLLTIKKNIFFIVCML